MIETREEARRLAESAAPPAAVVGSANSLLTAALAEALRPAVPPAGRPGPLLLVPWATAIRVDDPAGGGGTAPLLDGHGDPTGWEAGPGIVGEGGRRIGRTWPHSAALPGRKPGAWAKASGGPRSPNPGPGRLVRGRRPGRDFGLGRMIVASRAEVEEIEAGRGLAAEVGPMVRLAGPVVLAELGWMAMGLVDVAMVGRLGAEAIGAVGLGNHLFMGVTILGIGMLLGLDTVVSQAFGAVRPDVCHRALTHGSLLALVLAAPLMGAIWVGSRHLGGWGVDARVAAQTIPYVNVVLWSVPPLLLGTAARRYLQGMNLVRPAMVSLLAANLVNLAGNWVLVYGHLGSPALGVVGSGWATLLARWVMAAIVIAAALRRDRREAGRRRPGSGRFDGALLWRLVALGGPAAGQLGIEVGAFAFASVLAGRLGAAALAAHEVALNVCSLTFMVPLGVSSAGAVRVGQALGRGDPRAAGRAGGIALALGAAFMAVSSATFLLIPRAIFGSFTGDAAVLEIGVPLLLVAAIFQLFDGVQVVAGGLLRGAGDTRTPMVANAIAYWVLGLPVAAALAFRGRFGVIGLWIGLCGGLMTVSSLLLVAWGRAVRRLARDRPAG